MKNLFLMAFAAMMLLSMACNQSSKTSADEDAEGSVYACPMKCEGDKTYPGPGKCPVCGMALKPVAGAATAVLYEMRLSMTPAAPQAGMPVKLAFTPKIKSNEAAQVPLDEVHEKKLHIIIVSKDLAWYDHIHPDFQTDGSYAIDETFPAGGEYIIFADYQPSGAGNQVERIVLDVSGAPASVQSFTTESLTTQTDGYTVRLIPSAGKFLTNNMNHLGVAVTDKGKPVTNFENIMGAKGHLVIISGDGKMYLHVHPDEVEGKLDLHTQFDQPGIYRAFFQFQTNGMLHTSYFTINVMEGKPGELETPEGHHEHGKEGTEHSEHQ
ncbi:MAG TPA: heavy metal-binding domain-containing protein [Saprospiraceae bacterium]|nr:heavy metal-binding domain-containing protein [Saprospiraceae bacterium]